MSIFPENSKKGDLFHMEIYSKKELKNMKRKSTKILIIYKNIGENTWKQLFRVELGFIKYAV